MPWKDLKKYKKNSSRITIAIIDLIMPHMSGVELFRQLHAMNPGLKIILSSGFSNESTLKELMNTGAAGTICKPYSATELAVLLESVEMLEPEKSHQG